MYAGIVAVGAIKRTEWPGIEPMHAAAKLTFSRLCLSKMNIFCPATPTFWRNMVGQRADEL
jgi:hypothetical protein